MTQDQEIREAIEFLNRGEGEWTKPIQALIDLANRYLSCSSMMPSKKEIPEAYKPYCNDRYGYNSAIDDATFSLMKKCEGISNIIYEEIIVASGDGQVKPSQYVQNCSSAIQQYLTKGE